MTDRDRNCVLLAVHNGETYLLDQLISLLHQTVPPSELYILDDNSNDGSHQILENFILANEDSLNCVYFRAFSSKARGPSDAFKLLAEVASSQSQADVFFFCDQDDVWLTPKVEKSATALAKITRTSPNLPALIFADAYITDSCLNIESNSMIAFQALPTFPNHPIEEHIFQNNVSGFTVCCNRQALAGLLKVDHTPVIYDHWIALYCRLFGCWGFIDSPVALYRQHGKNAVGADKYKAGSIWSIKKIRRKMKSLVIHIYQFNAIVALIRKEPLGRDLSVKTKNLLHLAESRSQIDIQRAWRVSPKRRGLAIRLAYFALLIVMSRSR